MINFLRKLHSWRPWANNAISMRPSQRNWRNMNLWVIPIYYLLFWLENSHTNRTRIGPIWSVNSAIRQSFSRSKSESIAMAHSSYSSILSVRIRVWHKRLVFAYLISKCLPTHCLPWNIFSCNTHTLPCGCRRSAFDAWAHPNTFEQRRNSTDEIGLEISWILIASKRETRQGRRERKKW